MLLLIECIIACVLFTLIILPSLYREPIKHIMSYPPKIRKRVESLPQYQEIIRSKEKAHLTAKVIAIFLFAVLLAAVAYFSGARSFPEAYVHVFVLFFAVNIYDLFVLDIGLFCHSRKTRIPGTEDMDKEYRSPWHHVKGAGIGTIIGAVVSLAAGGIVSLMEMYF